MNKLNEIVSYENATHYSIYPMKLSDNILHLYCPVNGNEDELRTELEFVLGYPVALHRAQREEVQQLIQENYKVDFSSSFRKQTTSDYKEVDDIIKDALANKSSDIHIERTQKNCRVRIRIDGVLIERKILDIEYYNFLVNKIKVRSNLNIAEKRIPQDGRMNVQVNQMELYVRVSIIPTFYGEKIVLRLLGMSADSSHIEDVGMQQEQLNIYKKNIRKNQGLILISGPTGSGKTTTLYATLRELNSMETNITTVEDPIEYILQGLNQVQIKPEIDFGFSRALRSILRQDPDIIMIGEIRDIETAQIAIRASLTGHLVFATIHTNSAIDTYYRLIDMGIPEYLVSSSLTLSVAQRLIRKLCPDCKRKKSVNELPDFIQEILPDEIEFVYESVGCNSCYQTGFSGRKALFEVLEVDGDIQEKIEEYKHNQRDYVTLYDCALNNLIAGETSLSEVYSYLIN